MKPKSASMTKVFIAYMSIVLVSSTAIASDKCDLESLSSKFDVSVQLSEVVSISEIKEDNIVEITIDSGVTQRTFRYGNKYWEKLKSLREEGDCIVYFITGPETWQEFYGREGYMLARDGQPIYSFMTRRN